MRNQIKNKETIFDIMVKDGKSRQSDFIESTKYLNNKVVNMIKSKDSYFRRRNRKLLFKKIYAIILVPSLSI